MASLGRQINKAKRKAAIKNLEALRALQASQAESRIGGSMGSLLGRVGGTLLGAFTAMNPIMLALAAGALAGGGQYLGGLKGAKKTDKKRRKLMEDMKYGYGKGELGRAAEDMGDQVTNLRDSSIQTGVTDAASTFALAKGSQYLKSLGQKASISKDVGKIMEGTDDIDITNIVKSTEKLNKTYKPMSGSEYLGKVIGMKADNDLMKKYKADLAKLKG